MEPGRGEETGGPLGLQLAVAWVWCGRDVECHMGCKASRQPWCEVWTGRITRTLGGRYCQSPHREWLGDFPQAHSYEASAGVGIWPAQSCSAGLAMGRSGQWLWRAIGSYLESSCGPLGFSAGILWYCQRGWGLTLTWGEELGQVQAYCPLLPL